MRVSTRVSQSMAVVLTEARAMQEADKEKTETSNGKRGPTTCQAKGTPEWQALANKQIKAVFDVLGQKCLTARPSHELEDEISVPEFCTQLLERFGTKGVIAKSLVYQVQATEDDSEAAVMHGSTGKGVSLDVAKPRVPAAKKGKKHHAAAAATGQEASPVISNDFWEGPGRPHDSGKKNDKPLIVAPFYSILEVSFGNHGRPASLSSQANLRASSSPRRAQKRFNIVQLWAGHEDPGRLGPPEDGRQPKGLPHLAVGRQGDRVVAICNLLWARPASGASTSR
eukprot:gene4226-4528_t